MTTSAQKDIDTAEKILHEIGEHQVCMEDLQNKMCCDGLKCIVKALTEARQEERKKAEGLVNVLEASKHLAEIEPFMRVRDLKTWESIRDKALAAYRREIEEEK